MSSFSSDPELPGKTSPASAGRRLQPDWELPAASWLDPLGIGSLRLQKTPPHSGGRRAPAAAAGNAPRGGLLVAAAGPGGSGSPGAFPGPRLARGTQAAGQLWANDPCVDQRSFRIGGGGSHPPLGWDEGELVGDPLWGQIVVQRNMPWLAPSC